MGVAVAGTGSGVANVDHAHLDVLRGNTGALGGSRLRTGLGRGGSGRGTGAAADEAHRGHGQRQCSTDQLFHEMSSSCLPWRVRAGAFLFSFLRRTTRPPGRTGHGGAFSYATPCLYSHSKPTPRPNSSVCAWVRKTSSICPFLPGLALHFSPIFTNTLQFAHPVLFAQLLLLFLDKKSIL